MADQLLLGALYDTFGECLRLAFEHGLGLEIQSFAYPEVLQGDWQGLLHVYRRAGLERLEGPLAMHGAFMDMSPGSADKLIREATLLRVRQSLDIAEILGVRTVVFHTNFIASIQSVGYRYDWTQRNIDFWGPLAERAGRSGMVIALENMWEFEPDLIADILRAVDSPFLRACLDVGHSHLYSSVPFETWLDVLQPYLVHLHLNNTDGSLDEHHALTDGVLDYRPILKQIRSLPVQPTMTLEMYRPADMQASLRYFDLGAPRQAAPPFQDSYQVGIFF